jgi:hypothetical protein
MIDLRHVRPFAAAALGVFALSAYGCSSHEESAPPERLGRAHLPIIKGTVSTSDQDAVILLAVRYNNQYFPNCSGTMVAANLVMTARHCVGNLDDQGNVTDFPATELNVFTGADATQVALRGSAPAAKGKQLFTSGTTFLIPDIAFILLDRAVTAPIAPIRVDGGATKGEELTIVGFGIDETNRQPARRMQRTGVSVTFVGPGQTQYHDLFGGEFAFGEAACSGDSGGPALSAKTKAVVGVASRVSNGKPRTETDPSAFCIGSNTEDVYSSLEGVKVMLQKAFTAAGASPVVEAQSTAPAPTPDPKKEQPTTDPGAEEEAPPAEPAPKTKTTTTESSGCSASPSSSPGGGGALAAIAAAFVATSLRRSRHRERRARG